MSHKASFVLVASLVILNACGAGVVMNDDTPEPAMTVETSSPTAEPILTPTLTMTAVPSPTEQPTNSPTPFSSSFIGYDFETDTNVWHTSEGQYKMAEASVTTTIAYTGAQSLQITSELFGGQSPEFAAKNNDQVYLHTEVTGYFDSSVPDGMDEGGPYDLKGNRVSCFVYVPSELVKRDTAPATVRIFVKDEDFANQWGDVVEITEENAERWFELALIVDNTAGADVQFDPTRTKTLGIRFDVSLSSNLSFTGPIYIDSCMIEYS